VIVTDLLSAMPRALWWYPHSEKKYRRLKGVIELLFSRNLGKKLAGLGKMIALLLNSMKKW
jgi:hypothetical protein